MTAGPTDDAPTPGAAAVGAPAGRAPAVSAAAVRAPAVGAPAVGAPAVSATVGSPTPGATGLVVAGEVAAALAAGRPVVALESTIISHGMPYPDNLATARAVEQVVRDRGAVPATIALVDGALRIGLDAAALERLAAGQDVAKASRRDLPALMAAGATAGTTVAATMFLAHRAGIEVFATGGIGGVHRGAEHTFDVSADLAELGSTPVTVVCAGAKSILDLPKTLEVLETQGVPVLGVGTGEFPAFFTRTSGLPVDHRVDSATELAGVVAVHRALGLPGGILVANPIPERAALDAGRIDAIIEQALAEADRAGVTGKDVTPFLLARINALTGGESLAANVALIENNAALAADLAVALAARGSRPAGTRPDVSRPASLRDPA